MTFISSRTHGPVVGHLESDSHKYPRTDIKPRYD